MSIFRRSRGAGEPAGIAAQAAAFGSGGRIAAIVSAVALIFSAFSLWETSLKWADLRAYVAPVIHYSSPYQNSNFEMISLPVTLKNEGARTGTVLSMELAVTDPRTKQTKRFYAADFGRWTMEKTRSGAYAPFAPIALSGRESWTQSVLFYTRGEEEKPEQLIRATGPYLFDLRLETDGGDGDLLDRLGRAEAPKLTFERALRFNDARAFNTATLPLYAKDWRSAVSAIAK